MEGLNLDLKADLKAHKLCTSTSHALQTHSQGPP